MVRSLPALAEPGAAMSGSRGPAPGARQIDIFLKIRSGMWRMMVMMSHQKLGV